MSKKRTGLFVAAGCGLLLCVPLCAGVIGAGGFLWFSLADDDMASFEIPSDWEALVEEQFEAVAVEVDDADDDEVADLDDLDEDQADDDAEDANNAEDEEADDALDSGLDEEADDEDALVEADEGDEDVAEARIIEDDGEVTVTNTRPAPAPQKSHTTKPRDQPTRAAPPPQPEPEPFDDEEDFDDIAAEIAALDSLDDMEPSGDTKSAPSDKPGTIKVSGDYDRASVIGSDGVYRSPGKFDPGTYRLEITLDDGTVVNKTIKLKGGETVKLKCDVDAGTCTR